MVRVLHIVSVLRRGGVETMLMNFYRHIDREKVQFDFIVHGSQVGEYESIITKMGGKIFHVRTKSESFFGNLKDIREVIKKHDYKLVEVHQDAMSMFALRAAKQAGATVRIAHAHSTSMPPSKFGKLLYPFAIKRTTKYANVKFACSKKSAEYLFNGDVSEVEYVYNAIDINKFSYSKDNRLQIRQKYGLEGFVLAQVGNFMYPKNQEFTLLVFQQLLKILPNAKLVLCGAGSDMERIQKIAVEKNIDGAIIFTGNVDNIFQMLSAFDALIMPSFYEGFPVSLIEAQCAGLPCVVSDTITKETQITDLISYESLNMDPKLWAEKIAKLSANNRNGDVREKYAQIVSESGFDVQKVAQKLQNRYLKLSNTF